MTTKQYNKKLFGVGFIGLGAFFVIEHILVWDEFSFWDFIGHEWLGLLLILVGIGMNVNYSKEMFSVELRGICSRLRKLVLRR